MGSLKSRGGFIDSSLSPRSKGASSDFCMAISRANTSSFEAFLAGSWALVTFGLFFWSLAWVKMPWHGPRKEERSAAPRTRPLRVIRRGRVTGGKTYSTFYSGAGQNLLFTPEQGDKAGGHRSGQVRFNPGH